LRHQEQLARIFAEALPYNVTHLTVTQNLLPFLWANGALGGRTFDVLATSLPMTTLHQRLDGAHRLHPESKTLGDFRAEEWLLQAEGAALKRARSIVTPHTEIAELFSTRAVLVPWSIPAATQPRVEGSDILFPASTLGRKGAFEVRAAAKRLGLTLYIFGNELEGENFWNGVSVKHMDGTSYWLNGAGIVVLPAFVENRPRLLLEAVSAGIPVIASTACGLANLPQVTTVPLGNVDALCHAINESQAIR
jgi:hypothetical protein